MYVCSYLHDLDLDLQGKDLDLDLEAKDWDLEGMDLDFNFENLTTSLPTDSKYWDNSCQTMLYQKDYDLSEYIMAWFVPYHCIFLWLLWHCSFQCKAIIMLTG